MTYSGFTPGLNFGSAFDSSKVPITNLKYGSPIGGMPNTSPGSFSLEGLSPEDKKVFLMYSALAPKPADLGMITNVMEKQAEISRGIAKDKFKDEAGFGMMMTGVNAAAKGLQTALAGGSPEMLAYNAQAPLREGQAYIRNSRNLQRQEIGQQPVPPYMYPKFFNVG